MMVDADGLTSWLKFSHPSHTTGETFCIAVLPETKVKGFWAYLNGALLILFGWGGLIYLLLAWIFNW